MPKRKPTRQDKEVDLDDPLFRALRQVADEGLEEEIPERLLRVIRAAQSPPAEPGQRSAAPSKKPRAKPAETD
jgi:hypothetical protein